jgi:hypothetical protein
MPTLQALRPTVLGRSRGNVLSMQELASVDGAIGRDGAAVQW